MFTLASPKSACASPGGCTSGTKTGMPTYLDGIAEDFAGAFRDYPEVAEKVRQDLRGSRNAFRERLATDPKAPSPMLIHLKDARFFHAAGKPIPNNRGVWWRGRLSQVSGFMLGTLSAE